MQSLLRTCTEKELGLFRRDLRSIERALAKGPCTTRGSKGDCCGIGLAQCHALLAIDDAGSPLSSLAKELDIDASTLTRTLDGLERQNLVERHTASDDRRSIIVRTTAAGNSKVREINQSWNEWFQATLESMNADARSMVLHGVAHLAAAFRSRPCCSSHRSPRVEQ
jgi:DNA-binding MarR family transcriptional regulator